MVTQLFESLMTVALGTREERVVLAGGHDHPVQLFEVGIEGANLRLERFGLLVVQDWLLFDFGGRSRSGGLEALNPALTEGLGDQVLRQLGREMLAQRVPFGLVERLGLGELVWL